MNELDALVKRIQQEIDQEIRTTYSEKAYLRWKNPTHVGRIEPSDGWAKVKGSCGDTMEMYLIIRNDRIVEASAFTDGCGSSMVCGSIAAEMAEGKTLEAAMDIRGEDVVEALDGLPDEDLHCAFLAAQTLKEALHAYLSKNARAGSADTDRRR